MDIFIYFFERLNIPLDEVEDALDEALGDLGEVTGMGSGESGSNIDLEIADENDSRQVLTIIRSVLGNLSVPDSSIIEIEGVEHKVLET